MRFIAIQEGREDLLRDIINRGEKGDEHEDILYSEDQATDGKKVKMRKRRFSYNRVPE